MKPLILILLLAISVQGQIPQSLADAARKERERRAALGTVHVVTTEEARRSAPADSNPSSVQSAAPATPAAQTKATPAVQPPVVPKPDEALRKYNEDVAKLKAKIAQLQDQDTAIQLQMNDLKNAARAPVIDQPTQDQAKQQLAQAQDQLVATEKDLADTKKELDALEAQGPPKPQRE